MTLGTRLGKSCGSGYAFGLPKRIETALERLTAENARRVRCAHCPLMILPEGMGEHVRICHGDDD